MRFLKISPVFSPRMVKIGRFGAQIQDSEDSEKFEKIENDFLENFSLN